ncbi:MAG: hypothetical protein IH582_10915, partial [Afipia sp.]|nr:hypothetical protein [Afipia sp.]
VHGFAVEQWTQLPVPSSLNADRIRAASQRDAPLDEITAVVRLFQWLLPGLVVNVACFRAQIQRQ